MHLKPNWPHRIGSVIGLVSDFIGIGWAFHRGDTFTAGLLVVAAVGMAGWFAWGWTGSIFGFFEEAAKYVEGVEGDHRHEWYAFKGMRVRVFLDQYKHPWFALNEIAFILGTKPGDETFRHYGPRELATPNDADEPCLSEAGLRRLIRYSKHRDAGALGLWLERDVLRVLRNRFGQ